MPNVFDGDEKIADLSKGWQQFVLGTAIFLLLFNSYGALSAFSTGLAGISSSVASLLAISLVFAITFFLVKFIKRYGAASPSYVGFGLSFVAAVLLLLAVFSLNGFNLIVQSLLAKSSSINYLQAVVSIVFYGGAGIGIGYYANNFNKGSTPITGILSILAIPALAVSAVYSFSLALDGGISQTFRGAGSSWNPVIAEFVTFIVFAAVAFALIKRYQGVGRQIRLFYFQSFAFKIMGAGFVAAVIFNLYSMPLAIANSFTGFWELVVKTAFYAAMLYGIFRLSDRFKAMDSEAPKQPLPAQPPKQRTAPVIAPPPPGQETAPAMAQLDFSK